MYMLYHLHYDMYIYIMYYRWKIALKYIYYAKSEQSCTPALMVSCA